MKIGIPIHTYEKIKIQHYTEHVSRFTVLFKAEANHDGNGKENLAQQRASRPKQWLCVRFVFFVIVFKTQNNHNLGI